MKKGDMTAPENVQLILREPTIDSAVLETSCEGILRRGLGYAHADYGIVLNLHPREIESDYAKDLEDVAYAKSTVAEQVFPQGATVLNADSELIMEMVERAGGRLVLFTRQYDNRYIKSHIEGGGFAAVRDGRDFMIWQGEERRTVSETDKVPMAGTMPAQYGTDVILACIAALFAFGLSIEQIQKGIESKQGVEP
jgi:cyanophycin synthetase